MSNGSNETGKQGKEKNVEDELTSEEREAKLRLAAYYRWKAKGKKYGTDKDDWYEAEDSIAHDLED